MNKEIRQILENQMAMMEFSLGKESLFQSAKIGFKIDETKEMLNLPTNNLAEKRAEEIKVKGCGKKNPNGFDREKGYPLHDTCGIMDYLCDECSQTGSKGK